MAKTVKEKLKLHLILTLITYSFIGWIILIFIDFCGSNSSSLLLKNVLLRIDIIGILYIIIGYIIIFLWYWDKMCRYLDEIVSGIEMIYKQDDTLIELSSPLNEVEGFMNRIKMSVMLANKAAKTEENKKNEIVSYLAHDIRTPLTSIIGYLNLLDEIPDMDETKRIEYIHRVLDRAEHLEDLVNEFFEITQYNTGEVIANKAEIDIHYMFLQLQDEFLPMLEEKKNELVLDMKGKIIVNVDAEKLSRAFSNLLKNAILYSFPQTEIHISANIIDNTLCVKMKNKGKTIAKEDLGKIFGKFNRLDSARQSDNAGAGLGLSIAKEIINLHGGNIMAESSNNEITFHVEIPLE